MICSPVGCIYYTVLIFTFSGSIDERLQQQQTRIGGGNRISRDKASHLHRNKNNGGNEIIMQQQQPPYNNRLPPRLNSKATLCHSLIVMNVTLFSQKIVKVGKPEMH